MLRLIFGIWNFRIWNFYLFYSSVAVGAAKIILNNELHGEILNKQIEEIVLDKNMEVQMSKNALKVSTHDVEDKIYKEVLKFL